LAYFGRTFLRLNYIDITKTTHILIRKFIEIMAKKVLRVENYYAFIDSRIHVTKRDIYSYSNDAFT